MLNDAQPATRTIADPQESTVDVDKVDLQIIENLELNARASFTDIARDVHLSPQAVKHRFDSKLVPSGLVKEFLFDVVPYPLETAAVHEVMLRFNSSEAMNKFFSLVEKLFFVIIVAKVVKQNALMIRTYTLQSQVSAMFDFFSEMARSGLLESYSAVRLHLGSRKKQTIASELFNDQTKEWIWDTDRYLTKLKSLHEIQREYA